MNPHNPPPSLSEYSDVISIVRDLCGSDNCTVLKRTLTAGAVMVMGLRSWEEEQAALLRQHAQQFKAHLLTLQPKSHAQSGLTRSQGSGVKPQSLAGIRTNEHAYEQCKAQIAATVQARMCMHASKFGSPSRAMHAVQDAGLRPSSPTRR